MLHNRNFADRVKSEIERKAGKDYTVVIQDKVGINNIPSYTGISIIKNGDIVTPIIPLEPLEEDFENGEVTYEDIVDGIITISRQALERINKENINNTLFNAENIYDNVVIKVINTEKNEELLNNVPHKDFLDLSETYAIRLDDIGFGQSGITTINNNIVKIFNLDIDKLHDCAIKNMSERMIIKNSLDLWEEKSGIKLRPEIKEAINSPQYVITNEKDYYGAGYIVNPESFRELSEKFESDLYICPASVHELIIMPVNEINMTMDEVKDLVISTNRDSVKANEVLSDNVYYFDAKTMELTIVDNMEREEDREY